MGKFASIAVLTILYACSNAPADKSNGNEFTAGIALTKVIKKLEEASGLAASINNPQLLWTHNDSQNQATIFLIDEELNIRLTCKLAGIKNRDWEDITTGPGPDPGKNYVYVGEIGDNMAKNRYKMIYRFEEPIASEEQKEIVITQFDTITFQLADGPKDSEALLINPLTKDLYIVSKREKPVHVYELKYPQSTKDTTTALSIITLPLTQIVAGDFSADGKEILLKNYQNVYYWKKKDQQSVLDVLKTKPTILPYVEEPQGEAITFANDSSGYYTISEEVAGEKSYLMFYKRN